LIVRVTASTSGRIACTRPLNTTSGTAGERAWTAAPGLSSDPKQGVARHHGHALAHGKLDHDARDRRAQRDPRLRGAGRFDVTNLRVAHSRLAHALTRGIDEHIGAGAAHPEHGEKFLLHCDPCRHVELGERLAGAHVVERRAHVQFVDERARARLHDHLVALVVGDVAGGFDPRRHGAAHDLDRADAQVLPDPRARFDRAVARAFIDGHELHVHERRLAGLIETLARDHRVVPVEHLLPGGGIDVADLERCVRGAFVVGHLRAANHADAVEAIAAGDGGRGDDADDDNHKSCARGVAFVTHGRLLRAPGR
jgi:hypothetical protein